MIRIANVPRELPDDYTVLARPICEGLTDLFADTMLLQDVPEVNLRRPRYELDSLFNPDFRSALIRTRASAAGVESNAPFVWSRRSPADLLGHTRGAPVSDTSGSC